MAGETQQLAIDGGNMGHITAPRLTFCETTNCRNDGGANLPSSMFFAAAGGAAMFYQFMQMCALGMGRRPAQTLQAHARVSPPCACIFKSYKGTNIPYEDLHQGGHIGRDDDARIREEGG